MIRGVDLLVDRQSNFAPARSAGVLNPLTRKIVFVRPSVRPCVPHFLFVIWQLFVRNFVFENRRFWTKIRDFAAYFLFENRTISYLKIELLH